MSNLSLSRLTDAITKRAARAEISQAAPRSAALRAHLEERYDQPAGKLDSFLADPVLEARFGWQTAEGTIADLAPDILHPQLVRAMDAPPPGLEEQRLNASWAPYRHQLECWRLLRQPDPMSVLVSSGTGSGKTECFLVPVLDHLVRASEETAGPLQGIHALFLYPLNALINSQRDRLLAWTHGLGGNVRFCLYNGETRSAVRRSEQMESRSEVLDRRTLRQDTPPIVVTNTTMLEYMLVRRLDAPILRASRGKLRWIVIDEAHSYLGSQAAELSLLLRRVMHAFEVSPADVRFVATSATITSDEADSSHRLRQFLADLSDNEPARVRVITGHRSVPELPTALAEQNRPLPPLTELQELPSKDPEALFEALASNPAMRAVRRDLAGAHHAGRQLSELRKTAESCGLQTDRMIEWLDLCALATSGTQRFLPLRAHLFHRTARGLWACCNPRCSGRTGALADPEWPFGKLFLTRRGACDACGQAVFELLLCRSCGQEYLAAEETIRGTLRPRTLKAVDEDLEIGGDDEDGMPVWGSNEGFERLLVQARDDQDHVRVGSLKAETDSGSTHDIHLQALVPRSHRSYDRCFQCVECGVTERQPGAQFRSVRRGAAFFLSSAIPTLMEHLPPSAPQRSRRLPSKGRRLISFSDSRQGTARFALRSQREAERNFIRSWLYHQVRTRRPNHDDAHRERKQKLREKIQYFESTAGDDPLGMEMLTECRQKLLSLETGSAGVLPWGQAEHDLGEEPVVQRWLSELWQDQALQAIKRHELPRLLLLRELWRRPKWQNSVETLGLVALDYPKLRHAPLPITWQRLGFEAEEWHDFLVVAMDFFVRANSIVDVGHHFRPWLGQWIQPKVAIGPRGEATEKHQLRWPTVDTQHRWPRTLAAALGIDWNDPQGRRVVNDLLQVTWSAIADCLAEVADGRRLRLHEIATLVEVEKAWLCPVTRRVLPRTLRGISPYGAGDRTGQCRPLEMPRIPHPRWRDRQDHTWPRDAIVDWLEHDEAARELRQLGIWSDLAERLVIGADYYRTAEHSAQQSGDRLRVLEREFKAGQVNVLSCSTTMEMGVDIGGLSMVTMNNVPPSPANFLQRAGRAGRRDEPIAVSFTLCKATPHGEAVFNRPTWAFRTPIHVPRVSLDSQRISIRHVHAILLSQFFGQMRHDVSHDRLTAGWFFDPDSTEGPTPSDAFCDALKQLGAADDDLVRGIRRLVTGTPLEGRDLSELARRAATEIESLTESFRTELRELRADLETCKSPHVRRETPEAKAIQLQLKRFLGEYLLTELTQRGFLPGYGFPTQVVPFIYTTASHFEAERRVKESQPAIPGREDNRARWRSYPTRNLAIALRDYAPGNEVVLDGRVYTSQGVTLHWQVPANDELFREPQAIRWAWRCHHCHSSGVSASRRANCPNCHRDDKLKQARCLQPTGFAVGIRYQPHNNLGPTPYMPVEEPLISASGGAWQALPDRRWGRFRYSPQGTLLHHSRGLSRNGYALCLRCGRAASEPHPVHSSSDPLPDEMAGHKKLRRGRKDQGTDRCQDDMIRRGLWLGAQVQTDVFELQLQRRTGESISRSAALSIAVALRTVLSNALGVNPNEIGYAAVPTESLSEADPVAYSVVLYDTASGGAGFVGEMLESFPVLLKEAEQILRCRKCCTRACHACLLNYDSQHHEALLDRKEALRALPQDLIASLHLPEEQQFFGRRSRVRLTELAEALHKISQRSATREIEIFLDGAPTHWDLRSWPLLERLYGWKAGDKVVRLFIPTSTLSTLSVEAKGILGSLALIGIDIRRVETRPAVGPGHLLARALGAGLTTSWATLSGDALIPGELWGVPEDGHFLVEGQSELEPPPIESTVVDRRELRSQLRQIHITDELDGTTDTFGQAFWQHLEVHAPQSRDILRASSKIARLRYADRYVRNPWALKLLFEVLRELKRRELFDSESTIELATIAQDESRYRSRSSHGRRVHDNWRSSDETKRVLNVVLQRLHPKSRAILKDSQSLGHDRTMTIYLDDGRAWTLRLDWGFGFWRHKNHHVVYPFTDSATDQAQWVDETRLQVVGQSRLQTWLYALDVEDDPDRPRQ